MKTKKKGKLRQVKTIKKHIYDNEETPLISKQKEISNKFVDERFEEITNLDKKKLIPMMQYTDTKGELLLQNLINLITLLIFSIK